MISRSLILALWLVWAIYWIVSASSTKPIRSQEPAWARLAFIAQALLTAALLRSHPWSGWLVEQWVPGGWVRYWIAVALIVTGLILSIWARNILGSNWSGIVALKEGHELVQSGPYRWIRHPIYTGLLLMLLGTGLASGKAHGLLAFPIAACALWFRSRAEERWMSQEFGERYNAYRKKSWALIPFLL